MFVKAVFFDAAGTLFDPVRPVQETYSALARAYGKKVPPEEIRHRFKACFASSSPLAFPDAPPGEIQGLEREWWKNLVCRIFEPYGRFAAFDEYFASLFNYFSKAEAWNLYPETLRSLETLKARNLILSVVSNFDSRLFDILSDLEIAAYFDSVVISSRIGYAKPAPEIFHHALGLYSLNPEQAVHVGDTFESDVAGAAAAGVKPILLDRYAEHAGKDVLRVEKLSEILRVLD